MSKLSKNEKILLSILGAAILFYVYYTFFLNPILSSIGASKENISSYNSQLVNISEKETEIKNLENQYNELKVKYDDTANKFPKFEKVPQIAYDIKALADKDKVTLSNISFTQGTKVEAKVETNTQNNAAASKSPELYNASVNIIITGSYDSIKIFIKDLENEVRSTSIISTTLSKGENVINASLVSNLYYINDSTNTETNSYNFNTRTYGKTNLFN